MGSALGARPACTKPLGLAQHHTNLIEWCMPDPGSQEAEAERSNIEGQSRLFPFVTVNLKNAEVSGCPGSSVCQPALG